MTTRDPAEALATERLQIIAPLVDNATDAALGRQVTTHLVDQTGLSARTLRRWVAAVPGGGLSRLAPVATPAAVLDAAIGSSHRPVAQSCSEMSGV